MEKVSEVEFRGFDFRLVIEWGRVSRFEKLDKYGRFEESSSENSSELEFLTSLGCFWLKLKKGIFWVLSHKKYKTSQKTINVRFISCIFKKVVSGK